MATAEILTIATITGTPAYHDGKVWFGAGGRGINYCLPSEHNTEHVTLVGANASSAFYCGIDGYIYFQGGIPAESLTNKLIKMSLEGEYHYYAALSSTNCIGSAIAPGDGNVYFLTDGNKLMYVDANAPGTAATDFEGVECATTPVVAPGWPVTSLFYSTPDGNIRRIGLYRHGRTPGAAVDITLDHKTTEPLLACADGFLYFTVDKTLHRYALDGSGTHNSLVLNHKVTGGVKAFEADFDKHIYYLADDSLLYSLTVDPWPTVAPTTALCNTQMASPPNPGPAGMLFCRGKARSDLYKITTT